MRPLRYFHLCGVVDEAEVEAFWDGEELVASDALLARAELTVEVDDALARCAKQRFPSSLEGPPHLVLLTLARACDEIRMVEYNAVTAGDFNIPRRSKP